MTASFCVLCKLIVDHVEKTLKKQCLRNFIKAFRHNLNISFIKPDIVFLLAKNALISLMIVSDL